MADEFAIVHTVADTGGGTQDITSSDITDFTGAIFINPCATTLATDTAHARIGIGFCDASGNGACTARRAEDGNTAVPETVTWGSTSRCVVYGHPTATTGGAPTLIGTADPVDRTTSGVANGIRINWVDTPDAAYRMTVILFGGSTSVAVGQGSIPTSPTLENIGFEPDVVFLSTQHGNYGAATSATLDYDIGLGFAVNDGSETQASIIGLWDNATEPVDADAYVSTVEAGGEIVGGSENHASITAFSASGFTWDAESSTIPSHYLAIEFSDARTSAVAVETLPGSTGNASFTGLGLQPEFVFGIANLMTAENSLTDGATASVETLFAFNPTSEYSSATHQEEGITITNPPTTNANTRVENTALWLYEHTGTEAVDASWVSMDASGFTLNFSTATAGRMVVFGVAQLQQPAVVDEVEELSEVVTTLRQRVTVVDEVVQIGDVLVLVPGLLVSSDEVMEISEGVVTASVATLAVTGQMRNGSTLQAGGFRGSSLQSGGANGTTL